MGSNSDSEAPDNNTAPCGSSLCDPVNRRPHFPSPTAPHRAINMDDECNRCNRLPLSAFTVARAAVALFEVQFFLKEWMVKQWRNELKMKDEFNFFSIYSPYSLNKTNARLIAKYKVRKSIKKWRINTQDDNNSFRNDSNASRMFKVVGKLLKYDANMSALGKPFQTLATRN